MNKVDDLRIAWLVPSIERGKYWQPVLREFIKTFKHTVFFSGDLWADFDPISPGAEIVRVVGKMQYIKTASSTTGYGRGFIFVSPSIISHLLKFQPDVVFTSGFSLWTLLAILFKPLGQWRVVIAYDGSSPNIDLRDSKIRHFFRCNMSHFVDHFISNSEAGKRYLLESLGAKASKVSVKPYMVPDSQTLLRDVQKVTTDGQKLQRPVFLFSGVIVPRKGLKSLLEACSVLHKRGYHHYTLLVVGEGQQRAELATFVEEQGLAEQVTWAGWIPYEQLGAYIQQSDVFVFPTLEDIWGMVLPEAMALGKAVLCSQWAGAVEIVAEGINGYVFDPHEPEKLADLMQCFIDKPELCHSMGEASRQIMANHTPEAASNYLAKIASLAYGG